MVVKVSLACLTLLLITALTPLTAQAATPPDERTRVAVVGTSEAEPELLARVLASAANTLATSNPDAVFVDGRSLLSDGEADLQAAEEGVVDLLLHLRLGEGAEEQGHPISMELYDVRGRSTLATLETTIVVGRLGRYLRSQSWEELLAELDPYIEQFRPFSPVTIRTEAGAVVSAAGEILGTADADGLLEVELRNMRSYELSSEREAYRSRISTVYLSREPLEVEIDLQRYPVWMVELGLIGLSSPVIGGGRFVRENRIYLSGEINTRLFAFTPYRETQNRFSEDPDLISSAPVSELALGGDYYFRDRDRLLRPYAGLQLLGRFHHNDEHFGLEPILPFAVAPRAGAQLELSERFYLSSRVESRLYYVRRESFLRDYPLHLRLGDAPVLWNTALFYFGGRFAL